MEQNYFSQLGVATGDVIIKSVSTTGTRYCLISVPVPTCLSRTWSAGTSSSVMSTWTVPG